MLDIDALAAAEGKEWVYKGSSCLPPEMRYCMISLSDGGKDATVMREFDMQTGTFVENGFVIDSESQGDAEIQHCGEEPSRDFIGEGANDQQSIAASDQPQSHGEACGDQSSDSKRDHGPAQELSTPHKHSEHRNP